MDVKISRLFNLPADAFAPLLAESEREGWQFVRKLMGEWASGANRFDRPGEMLLGAWADGVLAGVCGLNIDPYAGDPSIGRVRRLYILGPYRGRGVGRMLVEAVVEAARSSFRTLRVRTECPIAGRLYLRLGFLPVVDSADCTYTLDLASSPQNTM